MELLRCDPPMPLSTACAFGDSDTPHRLCDGWARQGGRALPCLCPCHPAPIPLTGAQETAIKAWAADDRLWTTQETVEANLRIFARLILSGG